MQRKKYAAISRNRIKVPTTMRARYIHITRGGGRKKKGGKRREKGRNEGKKNWWKKKKKKKERERRKVVGSIDIYRMQD